MIQKYCSLNREVAPHIKRGVDQHPVSPPLNINSEKVADKVQVKVKLD